MRRVFDYLPFFIVALFAVTIVVPKVFAQDNKIIDHRIEPAIAQVRNLR
jgi:hypothetical protein